MDLSAVVRSAAVILITLVVPSVVVRVLAGSPAPDAVYSLYLLLFLFAFGAGGAAASRRTAARPLTTAAAAGALAFAVLALGGLVAIADEITAPGVLFLAVFLGVAVSVSMIGGAVALWRAGRAQSAREQGAPR